MFAQRDLELLAGLPNDRNHRRFFMEARPTGRRLGAGRYGVVEEVEMNGFLCAGKKIHEILFRDIGVNDIVAKYMHECQLMSDLRHPNITQFLGLCFLPNCQLPVLVMERLDGSMHNLLETVSNVSLTLKYSMLEDVARGLLYLHNHNPQIIHRDLSAKNVLLTSSLVAKITDLGNSRIVNIQPGQLAQTLSRNPGTLVYMPPEALNAAAQYGPSLDIFSFGHLGIFVGLQLFPAFLLEPTYMDPEDPHRLAARTEVERRREYIQNLEDLLPTGERHPFVLLVKRCLHNDPAQRPTSEELITALEEIKSNNEGCYEMIARIDAATQVVTIAALNNSDVEVREKTDQLAGRDHRINELQHDLEREQADRIRAEEHLQHVTTDSRIQLEQRDAQIQQQEAQLQEKDIQIHHNVAELGQIRALCNQRDSELTGIQQRLERLHAILEDKEGQFRAQEEEMKLKDDEINRLMGELKIYQEQLQRLMSSRAKPLAELEVPLKFEWQQGNDLPFEMADHVQAVVIGDCVYVGGGDKCGNTVLSFLVQTGTCIWRILPPYENKKFAMAAVNDQLVLVGGMALEVLSLLGVWDEGSLTWTHPFPKMPTPRHSPSVVSYQKWLVVAGGDNNEGDSCSKVEILNTDSHQWYNGSSLPAGYSEMSSALNGNMWYLSGGFSSDIQPNQHVFSICLDELISQAVSMSEASATIPSLPSLWLILTDTPNIYSTIVILEGGLMAMGGFSTSAIHLYQPNSRNWVKVGDLPTERSRCFCVVLLNGEIIVGGGQCGPCLTNTRLIDFARVLVL